jgi:hypothetical protein
LTDGFLRLQAKHSGQSRFTLAHTKAFTQLGHIIFNILNHLASAHDVMWAKAWKA